jgi:hypothetical protein
MASGVPWDQYGGWMTRIFNGSRQMYTVSAYRADRKIIHTGGMIRFVWESGGYRICDFFSK